LADESKMTITLEIASRLDQVRLIRAALSGVLNHLRVEEADIHALEIALTELVNNSIEHGYGGFENGKIRVQFELCDSEVKVDIIDEAAPFPEEQRYRLLGGAMPVEDPTDEWSMRGHGLQIVLQIVDSIALNSDAERNVLTVRKNVNRRDE